MEAILDVLQEVWAWDGIDRIYGIRGFLIETRENKQYKHSVYHLGSRGTGCYEFVEPYVDQDNIKIRPMTNPEVFKAISNGAVVRSEVDFVVTNYWTENLDVDEHMICYNYGDKRPEWEKLVVQNA